MPIYFIYDYMFPEAVLMKKKEKPPENLKALIESNPEGYKLRFIFSLQLKHGLMGYFPAIVAGSRRVVLTLDKEALMKVWKSLSPRSSEMVTSLAYVNEETMTAYPILGTNKYDLEESKPQFLFSKEELELRLRCKNDMGGEPYFKWAPGLIGDEMSRAEFIETLEAAAKEHGVKLPARN